MTFCDGSPYYCHKVYYVTVVIWRPAWRCFFVIRYFLWQILYLPWQFPFVIQTQIFCSASNAPPPSTGAAPSRQRRPAPPHPRWKASSSTSRLEFTNGSVGSPIPRSTLLSPRNRCGTWTDLAKERNGERHWLKEGERTGGKSSPFPLFNAEKHATGRGPDWWDAPCPTKRLPVSGTWPE